MYENWKTRYVTPPSWILLKHYERKPWGMYFFEDISTSHVCDCLMRISAYSKHHMHVSPDAQFTSSFVWLFVYVPVGLTKQQKAGSHCAIYCYIWRIQSCMGREFPLKYHIKNIIQALISQEMTRIDGKRYMASLLVQCKYFSPEVCQGQQKWIFLVQNN